MNEALVSHDGPGHRWLAALGVRGMELGLQRIRDLLGRIGDPQAALPVIAVAGTDGKGSTSAMLAALLQAAGLRVAHYTSPHLVETRERLCVDGRAVTAETLDAALAQVHTSATADPAIDPTPFEALTAAALLLCARHDPALDVIVLEVGLGGRLDAVNATEPVVSVITHLSYDHTAVLGDSLPQIAWEKAGIARDGRALVCAQPALVKPALRKHKVVPRLLSLGADATASDLTLHGPHLRTAARLSGPAIGDDLHLELDLPGAHQADNAALAVLAYLAFAEWSLAARKRELPPCDEVVAALAEVAWPLRAEVLDHKPLVIADAAHNPAGMAALAALLVQRGKAWQVVMAVRRDREAADLVRALAGVATGFFLPRCANPTLLPAAELAAAVDQAVPAASVAVASASRCFEQALREVGRDSGVVVCGSQHALGEWLQAGLLRSPRLDRRLGRAETPT
ncbi:MAG: hypothetical protein FJ100_02655 [Deltaproteobacteria bacterium]|nr:hypothetical protein [Deltaproteobacteria bacterium]